MVIAVDAGSSGIGELMRTCLDPFLRRRGIRRLDSIFITHPNIDHFSGVADLADRYGARCILISPRFEPDAANNAPATAMLSQVRGHGITSQTLGRGDRFQLDGHTDLEVLWPADARDLDANNGSLVLRLTHAGRSILLTGDIQVEAEEALLGALADGPLRADVLVAPHHGSAERTTEAFIRAVLPQVIISSNDRRLSRKQVTFEQCIGARPLYRTHRDGAIGVVIDPAGRIRIETFRGRG
jgi:competence protein ComEC